MAIALEFLDFVVPISVIRAKYPGGWEQCLQDHKRVIGGCVWYDNYLFRDGAMNSYDIKSLVEQWSKLGFTPFVTRQRRTIWSDVCVVEALAGGSTLPCEWLEVHADERMAHYRGTEPGAVVSRASFAKSDAAPL